MKNIEKYNWSLTEMLFWFCFLFACVFLFLSRLFVRWYFTLPACTQTEKTLLEEPHNHRPDVQDDYERWHDDRASGVFHDKLVTLVAPNLLGVFADFRINTPKIVKCTKTLLKHLTICQTAQDVKAKSIGHHRLMTVKIDVKLNYNIQQYPTNKIAEKAVWRSVFLRISRLHIECRCNKNSFFLRAGYRRKRV